MRPPRALERRKIDGNAAWLGIATGSSTESNQILYYPAIVAPNSDIANEDNLIADPEARANLLSTRSGIDRTHV
jgi:hypothetical protein